MDTKVVHEKLIVVSHFVHLATAQSCWVTYKLPYGVEKNETVTESQLTYYIENDLRVTARGIFEIDTPTDHERLRLYLELYIRDIEHKREIEAISRVNTMRDVYSEIYTDNGLEYMRNPGAQWR